MYPIGSMLKDNIFVRWIAQKGALYDLTFQFYTPKMVNESESLSYKAYFWGKYLIKEYLIPPSHDTIIIERTFDLKSELDHFNPSQEFKNQIVDSSSLVNITDDPRFSNAILETQSEFPKTILGYVRQLTRFDHGLIKEIYPINQEICSVIRKLEECHSTLTKAQWDQFAELLKKREQFYYAKIQQFNQILNQINQIVQSKSEIK